MATKKFLIKALATGLGSGYSPVIPGTIGSIPAWLLAYFWLGHNQLLLAAAAVVTTLLSVWIAGQAENIFGHDARKIVIDEWAGMFITLLFVTHSPTNYLYGFVIFRLMDVLKVFPARRSEGLPRGWGVTMDDVIAGIQSNILTQLVVWYLSR